VPGTLAETLCRQPGSAHFIEEFSGSTGIEVAAEQLADFGRFGLELLDQAADVVAIARQLRFEIIDLAGQNTVPPPPEVSMTLDETCQSIEPPALL
jgi:hypothetical protein